MLGEAQPIRLERADLWSSSFNFPFSASLGGNMPFINGRYHVNPIMGQALEAAREAEAALLALQQQASRDSSDSSADASGDDGDDSDDPSSADAAADTGPIHHVEIEATELVPSGSGRATRGFVAHVHRAAPSADNFSRSASRIAPPPETHVFSDHGDLVNFLRDALAKDCSQR
jgi:hypothetical protein